MGKERMKKQFVRLLVLLFVMGMFGKMRILTYAADMNEKVTPIRIEQVHAVMPDIELYYYLENSGVRQNEEAVQGVFSGKNLMTAGVESVGKADSIHYYFLLDVSASISEKYFDSVKEAIIRFQSEMNRDDTLTLITFGDKVNVIFENKTASDDCSGQIRGLTNKDMTTSLFQAIEQTADMVDTDVNAMSRSIALVISDGEDFTTNKTTANEALDTLGKTGLPVYSLVADKTARGADNTYINAFGEFSRGSGGKLYIFNDENAWNRMTEFKSGLYQAKRVKLKADNNQIYQTMQPLTLTIDNQISQTINLLAKRSAPDTSVPAAEAEEISNKGIKVKFSERVLHAEIPGNYKIVRDDDSTLTGYTVVYSESNGYEAVLTFDEEFYNGDYEISYRNICDDSREANPVKSVNTLTIEDGQKEDSAFVKFFKRYWVVFAAILIVLAVLVIALISYLKVKKNKGVVVVDGKVTFGGNVNVKQKVEIERKKGHEIIFEMNDRKQGKKEITMLVQESIFVGRSDICDLYFNDTKLSRQHFVIEEAADGFYIQDLNTTNGTMVNGVKIHQKRKLSQGDIIHAGMIELKVKW